LFEESRRLFRVGLTLSANLLLIFEEIGSYKIIYIEFREARDTPVLQWLRRVLREARAVAEAEKALARSL
jgi:hypothetical protein